LRTSRAVRRKAIEGADEKVGRLRLAIEKTDRRLIDLRQGLITAKSIEAERHASRRLSGTLSADSAIREAEAVLSRLIHTDDPVGEIEALDDLEADLAVDTVIEKMADAGFGNATKTRAQDILKRIKADLDQAAAEPAPQTP